ncbi:MAG: hypothetical protein JWO09_3900 [Bacteroidetes bacterium]|nr:hypothetical protein [Bacteroidota bacterium]
MLMCSSSQAICCTTCNAQLQQKIYDSTSFPNLPVMLSAFIVLTIIVALLSYLSNRKTASPDILNPVPLVTASMVLGIGIGGFLDGIVLHQILQWHEMLSNKMPPTTVEAKSVNMFWDGIFHFFTLTVVTIGTLLLWKLLHRRDIDRSGNLFAGGLFLGWGLFNIVEGVIDHHLLKLHNVKETTADPDLWNYGFLIISVVMIFAGYLLARKRNSTAEAK